MPHFRTCLRVWLRILHSCFHAARCILAVRAISTASKQGRVSPKALTAIGNRLRTSLDALGGAFLKVGQVLAMRPDLFREEIRRPLERLHDHARPCKFNRIPLESTFKAPLGTVFSEFDETPIATAAIAQVHRATLRHSGLVVAVKIRRPGIERIFSTDLLIAQTFLKFATGLPMLRNLPLREGFAHTSHALQAQTDLRKEANMHRRFRTLFASSHRLTVPGLVENLCSEAVLVTEYIPGLRKLTDPDLDSLIRRAAIETGLHALYKMLFESGLVHCDLHPGNILVDQKGGVVLLDFGFVAELSNEERHAFSRLFMAIAFNDAYAASEIVLETALRIPEDIDKSQLQKDIASLIGNVSGKSAGEFSVAGFVVALFEIQRRHQIYASPAFTMAIVSLMVYEGLIKQYAPDLDFQQEAVPFVMAALAG